MIEQKKLAVLIPLSAAVELDRLQDLSEEVIHILKEKPVINPHIIFTVNALDKDGSPTRLNYANQVVDEINHSPSSGVKATAIAIPHKSGNVTDAGGGRYVQGFYEAAKVAGKNGLVAEIDSRCHQPNDLSKVIDQLINGRQAVMSTRFFAKGAEHHFPLRRQLSSFATTIFGNVFGKPGMFIPDLASGLEGYTGELLNTIFKIRPHQDWITMRTLTMLVNTELRLYALWTLQNRKADLHKEVAIVPIVYAKGIQGKNFSGGESKKAISGLLELVQSRNRFLEDLKSASL